MKTKENQECKQEISNLGSQVLNLRNEIAVKDKQMTLLKEKLHDQCVEVNINIYSYLI